MIDLYRVKSAWHHSLPVGTLMSVGPHNRGQGWLAVGPVVPPSGPSWPKDGAQWTTNMCDTYLELAEGPW